MTYAACHLQALVLADFVNDNAGWWGLVALPLAVCATIAAVVQAIPVVRSAVRDEAHSLELLANQIRRRRVDDLESRLALGRILPARLRRRQVGDQSTSTEDLYERACAGAQVLVAGEAGAGKTMLALTLVSHSVGRSPAPVERPLMELIPLSRWRPPILRRNNWKRMTAWMAASLDETYPSFGARYFRGLLRSQKLIPCLDGLDEVPRDRRSALLDALQSYVAAGLPVVVLTRNPDRLETQVGDEAVARAPSFDLYELRPLESSTLASVVDSRSAWRDVVRDAEQPDRVTHLLSNPLLLSIATLTWGPDEPPRPLLDGADPEDTLWSTFLDRTLGNRRPDNTPSVRRSAGWIALLAAQRNQDSFRIGNLYNHPLASPITAAITAVVLFAIAWQANDPLGFTVFACLAIFSGLVITDRGLFGRLRKWSSFKLTRRQLFFRGALLSAPVVFVGAALFRNFMAQSIPTPDGLEPLWMHASDPGMISAWWHGGASELVVWTLSRSLPIYFLGTILMLLWVGTSDLTVPWGGPTLLPRWAPRRASLVLGAAMVAAFTIVSSAVFAFMGMMVLVPWIYLAVSRGVLWLDGGKAPRGRLGGVATTLEEAGVLYRHGDVWRFRHQELSRRLAREALSELAAQGELSRIIRADIASEMVDPRLVPAVLKESDRTTRGLLGSHQFSQSVLATRAMLLWYGNLQPGQALELLGPWVEKVPNSSLSVHAAEVLHSLGRHEEAEALWAEVLKTQGASAWVVSRWARRLAVQKRSSEAIAAMASIPTTPKSSWEAYVHVELAEYQCRLGSEEDFRQGTKLLDEMTRVAAPTLRRRALLELARIEAEVHGEFDRAERSLEALLADGAPEAIICARYAQLRYLAGDRARAEQLGRESASMVSWDHDPVMLLEALATTFCVADTLAPAARARAEAMAKFGWWLPGRRSSLLAAAGSDDDLLSRIFADARTDPIPSRS